MRQHYDRIDNSIYHAENDQWWQPDSVLYLLKTSVNPVRVGYFAKKLFNELKLAPHGSAALEVGCGGGGLHPDRYQALSENHDKNNAISNSST